MNSPKSSRHTGTPRRRSAIFALASTAVALRPATPKPAAPRAPKQKTPQLDAAALEEEYSVGRDYWHDKRIHNFGNVGFGGAFASMCAPLATKIIDAAAYGGRDVRAETAAVLKEVAGSAETVADLGCGSGASTRSLRKAFPGASVSAFDTSIHFLNVATWLTNGCPKERVAFELRNAEATGLEEASQDVVALQFVLHEAPAEGRARLLAEARRILRPGGVLAILDIALDYEPSEAMASGEPYVYGYLKNVRRDIDAAGFASVDERPVVEGRATLWLCAKDARGLGLAAGAKNNVLKLPPGLAPADDLALPAGAKNNVLALPRGAGQDASRVDDRAAA